jgi:hypothetical protein
MRFYGMLKILRYDKVTDRQNSVANSCPVSPPSLLVFSATARVEKIGG